jgi:hypothetical protein
LSDEAELEAYEYFNKNIRPLPKDSNGNIDSGQKGFQNNDVDAFRHAENTDLNSQIVLVLQKLFMRRY